MRFVEYKAFGGLLPDLAEFMGLVRPCGTRMQACLAGFEPQLTVPSINDFSQSKASEPIGSPMVWPAGIESKKCTPAHRRLMPQSSEKLSFAG